MRFLIDECLTPGLVSVANNRGFEAYHVVYRGWAGLTDSRLLRHLLDEELILVTNNRDDFLDLVSGVELHSGLVVILENVRRADQIALFDSGLDVLSKMASLVNKVVEIGGDGTVAVFEMPEID
jgi:predicted nuclease of predicted toxin-antitoxin system